MKLYDLQRPTMGGRPCFLSGKAVVPYPEFYPKLDGGIQIRCMLPVIGEPNGAKWFSGEIELGDVVSFLHHMLLDPEQTFSELFDDTGSDLRPDLGAENPPPQRPVNRPEPARQATGAETSLPRRVRLDSEPHQKVLIGEPPQKPKRVRL